MSCKGVIKCLMFFFNFIFVLVGLVIFIGGILGLVFKNKIEDLSPGVEVPVYLFPAVMVIGAVVFFISFCGCCGAIKEIDCMLITFSVVMVLLAIAKIGLAIFILVSRSQVEQNITEIINEVTSADEAGILPGIELLGKCCGTYGPSFYGGALPNTCCPISFTTLRESCDAADAFTHGCDNGYAAKKIKGYLNIISYSTIGIAVFELLSMMASTYLTCASRKSDYYQAYD